MGTVLTGAGDDLISGFLVRREAGQVTAFEPSLQTVVRNVTYYDANEAAQLAQEALDEVDKTPALNVGDFESGHICATQECHLKPGDEPTAFVQASDPVIPWSSDIYCTRGANIQMTVRILFAFSHIRHRLIGYLKTSPRYLFW